MYKFIPIFPSFRNMSFGLRAYFAFFARVGAVCGRNPSVIAAIFASSGRYVASFVICKLTPPAKPKILALILMSFPVGFATAEYRVATDLQGLSCLTLMLRSNRLINTRNSVRARPQDQSYPLNANPIPVRLRGRKSQAFSQTACSGDDVGGRGRRRLRSLFRRSGRFRTARMSSGQVAT